MPDSTITYPAAEVAEAAARCRRYHEGKAKERDTHPEEAIAREMGRWWRPAKTRAEAIERLDHKGIDREGLRYFIPEIEGAACLRIEELAKASRDGQVHLTADDIDLLAPFLGAAPEVGPMDSPLPSPKG